MESKRRTQEERSAATREALIAAARKLWGLRGYADVGTPEIASAAGVTRGAMYHQFADKAALFREVVEVVEQDVMARMAVVVAESGRRRRRPRSGARSTRGSRCPPIPKCGN